MLSTVLVPPQQGSFSALVASSRALRAHLCQGAQPREVVGSHGQRHQLVDLGQALDHDLAHRPDHLAPAEALLDALSLALADLVACVPRGARVDGAASHSLGVLRHVWRDADVAARFDEAAGVVGFVRTNRHALVRCRYVSQHLCGHRAFGRSLGSAGLDVDDQSVAVGRLAQSSPA